MNFNLYCSCFFIWLFEKLLKNVQFIWVFQVGGDHSDDIDVSKTHKKLHASNMTH